jgi:probable phosphoglycerate mutase
MADGLLILVRHGESAWNAEGRLQGQADAPLSDLGREQARALVTPLAGLPPAGLVTSDLSRAVDTAELSGHAGAARDPRWRERSMGEWTAELEGDVPQDQLKAFRAGELLPPGGESWTQLQDRVGQAVDELAARGGAWLVFTHGGPVRAAVAHATGADHRTIVGPANTSLTLLELGTPRRLLVFNWVPGARGIPRASEPGGAEVAVGGDRRSPDA